MADDSAAAYFIAFSHVLHLRACAAAPMVPLKRIKDFI
jgi:hypothetical protein